MSVDIAITASLEHLADQIRDEHDRVGVALGRALSRAIQAGALLLDAKAQLPHGAWLPWLERNCGLAERTAQAYMRLTRNRAALEEQNRNGVADIGVQQALKLLAERNVEAPPPHKFAGHIMPRMTPNEYARLKASIAKHGVITPVLLDERGDIIDGYERALACHELGVRDYPRIVKGGLTDEEEAGLHFALHYFRASYTPDEIAAVEAAVRAGGAA